MNNNIFSEITPDIIRLAKKSEAADIIDTELFTRYDVKRGLRDLNGKGVLAGLTHISDVRATETINGETHPAHGRLFYRGYDVKDLRKIIVLALKRLHIFCYLMNFQTKRNFLIFVHFFPSTAVFRQDLYVTSL